MNTEDTRDYWDAEAAAFDNEADHGLTDPVTRAAWTTLLDGFLTNTDCNIIDLGCGTGSVSELLAQRGHQVYGVDLSPKMIEQAQLKAQRLRLEIDFVVGDVRTAPVPTTPCGAVLSRHLLWAIPDPAALVARWSEPLTADGIFIAIEGVWNTAGMEPDAVCSALESQFDNVEYTDLSHNAALWGKTVTDHRYVVVASQRR